MMTTECGFTNDPSVIACNLKVNVTCRIHVVNRGKSYCQIKELRHTEDRTKCQLSQIA